MTLSKSPLREAWEEFNAVICPCCEKPKKSGQSFCGRCYFSLPENMRRALYKRFVGGGYEEAYSEAKDWLAQQRKVNA